MNSPTDVVFVVDDDPSVLKALSRLLRSEGLEVHTFRSAKAFLEQHDPSIPGCLVLDVAMPEINGLELQNALVSAGAPRPIVFITGRADVPTGIRAMRAGAVHFLMKPVSDEDLLRAVREALNKDRAARQELAEIASIQARLATLTPRERQVLEHVVEGRLNKQIAGELGTVEKTVKVHRARVMHKMRALSLADLVRMAGRAGIPSNIP